MHILITVHFNAPHGGLHENILATIRQCLKRNHQVSVLCREGDFANLLRKLGVQVIITDYASIARTIEKVMEASSEKPFDIIHTHPGPSRKVAVSVANRLNLPIFLTIHGMWIDNISEYASKYSAIFSVSEGIRDYIKSKINSHYEKILVMPNGVNKSLFNTELNKSSSNEKKEPITISLITRLDKDKEFIIDMYYKALKYTFENHNDSVNWTIVGDGAQLEEVKSQSIEITDGGKQSVQFVGWKTGNDLRDYYLTSDIVIAPGRCALEAMSCGKPVIAIGSKKYNGLVNKESWMNGVYTNFGGLGNKMDDYIEGTIENDLKLVIENAILRRELGELGIFITNQFYNEEVINDKIIGIYEVFTNKKSLN
jgi:glycosyltransferase involved in cell wall biosynthesis